MKKHATSYIFIASLGVMFNASLCLSETSIALNNGAEISFQTGDLDLSDYSGEASELIYNSPDGLILTAENVFIQTNKKKTIYRLVEINKFEITSQREPYNLSADFLELRNFPHSLITQLFEKSEDPYVNENFLTNLEWDIKKISPKLKLLAVDFKLNDIFSETEMIKADVYPISDNQAKNPSLVNFEFLIENSDLTPIGDSKLATSLASILSDLELQKLSLSLFAKSQLSQINNIQHAKFNIHLTANQIFGVVIHLYIEYPVIENTLEIEDTKLAIELLSQIKLHKIKIELEDFGLYSGLSNSRLSDYHSAAENLGNFLVAYMPANGQRLTTPITKFVNNGGKLTILSHPRTPKPIALISSILLFPDLIIEEFAISSAHHQ